MGDKNAAPPGVVGTEEGTHKPQGVPLRGFEIEARPVKEYMGLRDATVACEHVWEWCMWRCGRRVGRGA